MNQNKIMQNTHDKNVGKLFCLFDFTVTMIRAKYLITINSHYIEYMCLMLSI